MDYQKLDTYLVSALDDAQENDCFLVFVSTTPVTTEEVAFLANLGIANVESQEMSTGKLTAKEIDLLSEKPWVKSIALSQKLRLQ